MAGGYWLVGLCYSRGYDFFLWVHNAWLAREGIAGGVWPAWTLSAGAGQPVFKISGIADALVLGALGALFSPSTATQVMTVGLYAVAGAGMFTLAHSLVRSAPGAAVAAAAYVFSWFMTYTAYYQAYLNNLFCYALLPWGALLFVRAVRTGERRALLGAAAVLGLSILANAQVGLKVMLFVLPLGLVYGAVGHPRALKGWMLASGLVVGFALWWSLFLIAPALEISREVVVPGELRGNAFIPPWLMLFWVPLFGLNFLWYRMGGGPFLDREVLAWVIFSDYVGLSVLALALCAWGYYRVHRDRRLIGLGLMLAGYWAIFFGIVPFLQASSWVGRTHNWALLPTLVLSLLCSYGTSWLIGRLRLRAWQVAGLACGLVVADLGGVSFFLNRLAITHTRLEDLPEVQVWREVESGRSKPSGRWFTFNPDHTHYLLPAMTGRPTANVIDLRARTWEYDSYLAHQLKAMRTADPSYQAAESLGLLDVAVVDLPAKLFALRGNDPDLYPRAAQQLEADPHLEGVYRRNTAPEDRIYDAYDPQLRLEQIATAGAGDGQLAQVVFANQRHRLGFVPEHAVLLLGNTREGERFFEGVTHLPGYRFDRVLYVLAEEAQNLDPRALASFSGCIPLSAGRAPTGLAQWSLDTLGSLYLSPCPELAAARATIEGEQALRLEMEAAPQPRFASLAIQRFADWQAHDEYGAPLPAFKAGAGLTALWVPAGVRTVHYRYQTPRYEQVARLCSALGVMVALWWGRAGAGLFQPPRGESGAPLRRVPAGGSQNQGHILKATTVYLRQRRQTR
ncbi:MAG: hypothetical protein FJY95_15070 [Candidatus Handelsmanbacteria bacterium]|nr:hypothetical protein [Candidatus Handelsmanbacteria bacterium]